MITSLLLSALIAVESSGNPNAVGDAGRAVGVLQIRPCVVADVNAYAGTRYTLADRRCPQKSREMFRLYIQRYATPQRLGRSPTQQDIARIWNGGPAGWKRQSTVKYWTKVQRAMKR